MRRVGVLTSIHGTTTLIPGLVLETGGRRTRVLIEIDGEYIEREVCPEYAEPVGPDTAAGWERHWERLDLAAEAGGW